MRIVAATNRDLEEEVQAGRFREDLYYRLNVIQIALPPLRERLEDVPLLVHHFMEKYRRELGKDVHEVSRLRCSRCSAHTFPGNVRELENMIERAVTLARGPELDVDVLPGRARARGVGAARIPATGVDLDGCSRATSAADPGGAGAPAA